jgi:hypothetical protein
VAYRVELLAKWIAGSNFEIALMEFGSTVRDALAGVAIRLRNNDADDNLCLLGLKKTLRRYNGPTSRRSTTISGASSTGGTTSR